MFGKNTAQGLARGTRFIKEIDPKLFAMHFGHSFKGSFSQLGKDLGRKDIGKLDAIKNFFGRGVNGGKALKHRFVNEGDKFIDDLSRELHSVSPGSYSARATAKQQRRMRNNMYLAQDLAGIAAPATVAAGAGAVGYGGYKGVEALTAPPPPPPTFWERLLGK
jgi:hypothetical protein